MSATGDVRLLWGTTLLFSACTLLLERWVHAVWSAMDTTAGRGVLEINSAHVVSYLSPLF